MVIWFLPNCSYPIPLLQIPDSMWGEDSLLGLHMAPSCHVFSWWTEKQLWRLFLFHNSIMAGPNPWPHPNPLPSQRPPLPNTIPLVVWASIDEFWVGHTFSPQLGAMFLCLTADACGQMVERDKQRKEMEKHNQFTMRNLDTFSEQKVMQYHLTKVEYKILY